MTRLLAVLALATCLAGCATVPPPAKQPAAPPAQASAPPPSSTSTQTPASGPAPGTTVGSTASGGTIRINPAVNDSSPSPEALAVLGTIPDPLGTSAPESLAVRPGWGAPPDTDSAATPENTAVPVPEPTEPLGDRPGSAPPPVVTPPAAAALPRAAPAVTVPPDSCWRVQFAAPTDKAEADAKAEAAGSQLMIPIVIEKESGRYKVRSRDCATASVADDLKRRAEASGFEGAFRFKGKQP